MASASAADYFSFPNLAQNLRHCGYGPESMQHTADYMPQMPPTATNNGENPPQRDGDNVGLPMRAINDDGTASEAQPAPTGFFYNCGLPTPAGTASRNTTPPDARCLVSGVTYPVTEPSDADGQANLAFSTPVGVNNPQFQRSLAHTGYGNFAPPAPMGANNYHPCSQSAPARSGSMANVVPMTLGGPTYQCLPPPQGPLTRGPANTRQSRPQPDRPLIGPPKKPRKARPYTANTEPQAGQDAKTTKRQKNTLAARHSREKRAAWERTLEERATAKEAEAVYWREITRNLGFVPHPGDRYQYPPVPEDDQGAAASLQAGTINFSPVYYHYYQQQHPSNVNPYFPATNGPQEQQPANIPPPPPFPAAAAAALPAGPYYHPPPPPAGPFQSDSTVVNVDTDPATTNATTTAAANNTGDNVNCYQWDQAGNIQQQLLQVAPLQQPTNIDTDMSGQGAEVLPGQNLDSADSLTAEIGNDDKNNDADNDNNEKIETTDSSPLSPSWFFVPSSLPISPNSSELRYRIKNMTQQHDHGHNHDHDQGQTQGQAQGQHQGQSQDQYQVEVQDQDQPTATADVSPNMDINIPDIDMSNIGMSTLPVDFDPEYDLNQDFDIDTQLEFFDRIDLAFAAAS